MALCRCRLVIVVCVGLLVVVQMTALIDALQLDKLRKQPKNVVILDASWHLPNANRQALTEFEAGHIVGARFFDLSLYFDAAHAMPHMLTHDVGLIASLLQALGISNDDKIIFYDQSDLHSSCRAWWMFRMFGHDPEKLFILNGGLLAWKRFGGKVEVGPAKFNLSKGYVVNWQSQFLRTLNEMKQNEREGREQVVDVRHPVRYAGGQEIRPNMRLGHIPGSYSFPFMSFYESNGEFKPLKRIETQLRGTGLDFNYPIVSMCGSGITSAILNYVLELLGVQHHALYDGSFSEWGADYLLAGEVSLDERPVVRSVDY